MYDQDMQESQLFEGIENIWWTGRSGRAYKECPTSVADALKPLGTYMYKRPPTGEASCPSQFVLLLL